MLVKEICHTNIEVALYRLFTEAAQLGNHFFKNFPEYITPENEKHEALFNHYLPTEDAKKNHAALLEHTEQIKDLSLLMHNLKSQYLAVLGEYLNHLYPVK